MLQFLLFRIGSSIHLQLHFFTSNVTVFLKLLAPVSIAWTVNVSSFSSSIFLCIASSWIPETLWSQNISSRKNSKLQYFVNAQHRDKISYKFKHVNAESEKYKKNPMLLIFICDLTCHETLFKVFQYIGSTTPQKLQILIYFSMNPL